MLQVGRYVFKCADARHEFEQIHRLNYQTFVGEIPQHADNGDGFLVDKFHRKNAYFVVLKDDRLVGMLSVHDQAPFSVAERLSDPSILTRPGTRPLEVRLLAVEPEERNSNVFFGLIYTMYTHAVEQGYTHLFISGVEGRLDLYEQIGFAPLGPAVRSGQASFVPMVLEVNQLPYRIKRMKNLWEMRVRQARKTSRNGQNGESDLGPGEICLLPGPVTTSQAVRDAFHQPPTYHRGPEFIRRFLGVRQLLAEMVGGRAVAILNGSGTLANETIAATLAALQRDTPRRGHGVLLINGEFGNRLAKQATRFGLEPQLLSWPWGKPWNLDEVDAALAKEPEGSWVWGVHQESSTGVLNDLPGLVKVARRRGIRVCVDCISSLGAVPLDLRHVFLASGATGKSLGSYAGAALIFADAEALQTVDRTSIPSYFDIAAALSSDGPCYTFPSPTLLALEAALQEYATTERAQATYQRYAELGSVVRQNLRQLGLEPLAEEEWACPVVTTFTPPGDDSAGAFVDRCRAWGFAIGGQSAYLAERRFVQIATMGAMTQEMVSPLFERIGGWLAKKPGLALAQ
ncbi:MAG TPA: aminotransferase class V-fold PLP-dependent enzyme [Gemmataceae bacterium]|nr:aminotransferase class V-fold PLP-dependent enzyme [Gemmataceae bacterium]